MAGEKQKSFADTVKEMLAATAAVCAICASDERADIEAARANGAPYSVIAQALQRLGTIDPNVTRDTASKRVRVHFETPHGPDKES